MSDLSSSVFSATTGGTGSDATSSEMQTSVTEQSESGWGSGTTDVTTTDVTADSQAGIAGQPGGERRNKLTIQYLMWGCVSLVAMAGMATLLVGVYQLTYGDE